MKRINDIRSLYLVCVFVFVSLLSYSCSSYLTFFKRDESLYRYAYACRKYELEKNVGKKKNMLLYVANNPTHAYVCVQGNEIASDFEFLDALLLVKKRKNYAKVCKYNDKYLFKRRLRIKDKPDNLPWVKMDNLLEHRVMSGSNNMAIVAINDTMAIRNFKSYFKNIDSVYLFEDYFLEKKYSSLALYDTVYVLKKYLNASLVSESLILNHKDIKTKKIGWISNSLLFNNIKSNASLREIKDMSNCKVTWLNSDSITFAKSLTLVDDMRNINIIFALETSVYNELKRSFVLNILRDLTSVFTSASVPADIKFRFSAVYKKNNDLKMTNFSKDYGGFLRIFSDSLSICSSSKNIKQEAMEQGRWETITYLNDNYKSIDNINRGQNIIVLIGEKGLADNKRFRPNNWRNLQTNFRLVACQIYSKKGISYNNFILQSKEFINNYANNELLRLKSYALLPFLNVDISRSNNYIALKTYNNCYLLDYPNNSVSQGAVVFAQSDRGVQIATIKDCLQQVVEQVVLNVNTYEFIIKLAFLNFGSDNEQFTKSFSDKLKIPAIIPSEFKFFFRTKQLYYFSAD